VSHFVSEYGLWVVFVVIFIEVGGIPFIPGEAALIAAAAAASKGHGNIVAIVFLAFAAAVLGALASYLLGRRWGKQWLRQSEWLERHTEKMLEKGEEFFTKHGSKAVFLGRFVPIVRALLGWLAGINEMSFARFMLWNVLGAAAWSSAVGLVAYYAGQAVIDTVQHDALLGVLVIVGIAVLVLLHHWWRKRREARA
jgi:membrane protein DedA with SNARE-associated domain